MNITIENFPEDVESFIEHFDLELRFNMFGDCALFFHPDVPGAPEEIKLVDWLGPVDLAHSMRSQAWAIFAAIQKNSSKL